MKKYDVTALGELLIDLLKTEKKQSEIHFLKQIPERHLVVIARSI